MSATDENATSSSALHRLGTRSAQTINAVLHDIRCLYFVFRNPGTPWYARALLFVPLAYLCSPIQLIPNFIPVLGQMDDLLVIWLSNKLVRRLVDAQVLQQARERAAAHSFAVGFSGKSFYLRRARDAALPQPDPARPVAAPGTTACDSEGSSGSGPTP